MSEIRIIAGLGNPGDEYKGTRHNMGFETINKLSFDFNILVKKKKHRAYIGEGRISRCPVLLVKPQTFMNNSGESVRAILKFYQIPPSGLIAVYDDASLPVGDIRVRERGSDGGHNGVKSLIQHLGTQEFPRVRIGIGEKPPGWDLADYVLSRFRKEEWPGMIDGITKAGDAVVMMLAEGIEHTMNKYNKKVLKENE